MWVPYKITSIHNYLSAEKRCERGGGGGWTRTLAQWRVEEFIYTTQAQQHSCELRFHKLWPYSFIVNTSTHSLTHSLVHPCVHIQEEMKNRGWTSKVIRLILYWSYCPSSSFSSSGGWLLWQSIQGTVSYSFFSPVTYGRHFGAHLYI